MSVTLQKGHSEKGSNEKRNTYILFKREKIKSSDICALACSWNSKPLSTINQNSALFIAIHNCSIVFFLISGPLYKKFGSFYGFPKVLKN